MNSILQTSDLNLTPVRKTDLSDIHQLHILPQTNAFNTLGIPKDIFETEKILGNWINRPQNKVAPGFIFCIRLNHANEFVGLIAINKMYKNQHDAEIWYKIHPDFWNRGYATAGLQTIIRFGFEILRLRKILAGCAEGNVASIRVLEKAGMRQAGISRKSMLLNSGWSDRWEYIISDKEAMPAL